ncbi:MAG: GGDEF-domain containing protein, partial [Sphingomonas bacterium]
IEDGAIEERLRALGCSKGQGYLYGRPMSITNTRRLLAEKRLLRPTDTEKTERKPSAGKRLVN